MARPSKTYPSERAGKPCGASWPDPLRVTGKLPRVSYGSQFATTLEPVASTDDLRANQGLLSWRGEHETRIRARFESLIDQVASDAQSFRWRIGEANYAAVKNLLALALAELAYVDITHERWVERRWGLERLTYAPECDARGGLEPGAVFGGGFDRCPTVEEMQLRLEARDFIVEKFVDAAHFIRCAQYGLWRVWLYRSALAKWQSTPRGGAPDDLAPTPPKKPKKPVGAGSFRSQPLPPPPPPVPPPPQPEPPPFPADLGEGGTLPDPGEPDPPDEDAVPSPPEPPLPEPEPEPEPIAEPTPEVGESPSPKAPWWPGPSMPTDGSSPMPPRRRHESHEVEVIEAGIDAGAETVTNVVVTAAVAKVATVGIIAGGVVGVTWLLVRGRTDGRT